MNNRISTVSADWNAKIQPASINVRICVLFFVSVVLCAFAATVASPLPQFVPSTCWCFCSVMLSQRFTVHVPANLNPGQHIIIPVRLPGGLKF